MPPMRHMRRFAAALLLALAAAFVALPAGAIELDAARAQGLVGETRSGFIAPVSAASAEVQALVDEVNAKRRSHYLSIARRNGVDLEEVGRITAEKLINGLPSGAYFEAASGGWRRK